MNKLEFYCTFITELPLKVQNMLLEMNPGLLDEYCGPEPPDLAKDKNYLQIMRRIREYERDRSQEEKQR